MSEEKQAQMKQIRDEVWNLTESPLYAERVKNGVYPVIGEGSHDAKIMFIGEAPGKNEAKEGRPFCGAAGKILDELLASISLPRTSVYITNIVKDRPPQNRDPHPEEIAVYSPFLDRQVEIIEPDVIATLGRFSMEYIFKHFDVEDKLTSISKMHGEVHTAQTIDGKDIVLLPLYHPAAAIYNQSLKDTLKEDFEKLKAYM